jgi:hypothetical protein
MHHVPSPVLRRLSDDPLAVPDRARRHVDGCSRCQAQRGKVAGDAALASRLLSAPSIGDVGDVDLEWIMLTERLRQPDLATPPVRPRRRHLPLPVTRISFGAGTAAVAAVIAAGAGAAAALTTVFAPTHVAPVRVSNSELQAISSITGLSPGELSGGVSPSGSVPLRFGELSWTTTGQPRQVNSVAQARVLTHLAYAAPQTLPSGVGSLSSIEVLPQVSAAISFGPSASGGVAGSTLEITAGPGIVVQYGANGSGGNSLTTLAIVAMRRPLASSTGATASELEKFLLSQPGIPSGLAEQLKLLGNPATVLPVPVPSGASEQQLTIGGASAVLVTDRSGAASGVIWESRDGIVHGVGGLLDSGDVLRVARQVG